MADSLPSPPLGPSTVPECMEWPTSFVDRLTAFDEGHGTEYTKKLLKRRVVLTSCFSGSGGAETALAMLPHALAQVSQEDT